MRNSVSGKAGPADRQRLLINVNGVVQGVGFRPFVYRLATDLHLAGFVSNNASGVVIEIEGPSDAIAKFRRDLIEQAPPLAHIDDCGIREILPAGDTEFCITASQHDRSTSTLISPDVATCDDCLAELFDPDNRRHRYPFINCTNCGPRFTIVEHIPYDRPNTSMKSFTLCADCAREYNDPADRRFHAQPNACDVCGPGPDLRDGKGGPVAGEPVATTVDLLRRGMIVAVRGVGGFHLAVDATNDDAVQELRRRKLRAQKPLAMMTPDINTLQRFCFISPDEEALLRHHTRPIVLLHRRPHTPIAPSVAYENHYFGFMLPYTPLHHLIVKDNFDALVMTSANLAEEPIAIGNEEALAHLGGIADYFLLHNREILQRCDDSIARVVGSHKQIIRRARGFVPQPVYISSPTARPILACGGELKNTVALSRGDKVFLSQHIGDMDNPASLNFFEECIRHLQQVLEIEPESIAYDLHPEYLSTKWARRQEHLPSVGVQHHHAHLVSVMADNGITGPTIGLVLDGTGYGTDGTIWGGEILIGDTATFERFAWLDTVPMPGGQAAIRQPWRMALSYLVHAFGRDWEKLTLPLTDKTDAHKMELAQQMIARRVNCPLTSSCGRLFDGVSAILGICTEVAYEAQAAIMLEMAAGAQPVDDFSMDAPPGEAGPGPIAIDSLIRMVVNAIVNGDSVGNVASRFHTGLAELFVSAVKAARDQTGLTRVGLSGGVFQNARFFEYVLKRLEEEKFDVLCHKNVPTNDGGLALGQVVVADAMLRQKKTL